MTIPQTCADFVAHPHKVMTKYTSGTSGESFEQMDNCYSCREASASEEQGTTQIAQALTASGIECSVEQTGGFCMVVYIYSKDKTKALTVNGSGGGFEIDVENGGEYVEITPEGFQPWEKEGCPPEVCAEIVKMVQANLYRLS
jgi:hypothetical protein